MIVPRGGRDIADPGLASRRRDIGPTDTDRILPNQRRPSLSPTAAISAADRPAQLYQTLAGQAMGLKPSRGGDAPSKGLASRGGFSSIRSQPSTRPPRRYRGQNVRRRLLERARSFEIVTRGVAWPPGNRAVSGGGVMTRRGKTSSGR